MNFNKICITSHFHDKVSARHPGEIKTLNAIKEHYWWPGMRSFIKNYVKGCGICQQFKINRNPSNPSYIPIPGPMNTRLFTNCSMDMITDLPPIKLENGMIIWCWPPVGRYFGTVAVQWLCSGQIDGENFQK